MKLVLEILGDDGETATHRVVSAFPLTVGRGYHNDLILPDPHVGERHLSVDFDGSCWTLTDHGSVNPTLLNGKPVRAASARLSSGDVLRAGHTTLRVFAHDHPVEAPVKMQKMNPVFQHLTRPLNVWSWFALAAVGVAGWRYVGVWSPDDTSLSFIGIAAGAGIIIFVWAALWSVAGRLIRRRSWFLAHVALMSLYLALGSLVAWFAAALDFLLNQGWAAVVTGYLLNGALLTLLLYGSLSLSTLLKKKKRLMAAVLFAVGLTLGVFAVGMAQGDRFNPDPDYPSRLVLFLSPLAHADTLDGFMKDSADVFASDTFEKEKADSADKPGLRTPDAKPKK